MNNRILHIDVAKGIGILLVVLGHNWIVLRERGELFTLIYSFHVPLFFLLSGIFFNPAKPFHATLIEKADSILKPYFVTLLGAEFISRILAPQEMSLPAALLGIVYGTANLIRWAAPWFLPHLFALFIFAWIVIRITGLDRRPLPFKIALLGALLGAGYLMIGRFTNIPLTPGGEEIKARGLPFSADLIFITGFYFLLGWLLQRALKEFKANPLLLAAAVLSFLTLHYFTNYRTDLNLRRYDNLLVSTLLALLGIYIVLALSWILSKVGLIALPLARLGRNSLIILLFHYPIQTWLFQFLGNYSPRKFIMGLIAFAASSLIALALAEIIRRIKALAWLYLPLKESKSQSPRSLS